MNWAAEPTTSSEYARIFDARGRAYHEAMRRWPHARDREFQQAVALADLRAGQRVADFPSGGGYLRPYLEVPVRLVLLETSRAFLDCVEAGDGVERRFVEDGRLPLADASLDRVISVAGLHHVADKPAVFQELRRCLKPCGRLVVADVAAGSSVGRFLNEFVDAFSDEGHDGRFLDDATADELRCAGFDVRLARRIAYPWRFAGREEMVEFCRLLFGLVKASPLQIGEALEAYLGCGRRNDAWELNWELLFLAADVSAAG